MPSFLILQPRCVFIHNPKTGGMALRNAIMEEGNFEGPITGPLPQQWQQEFSFGFVRNPFDRLVSAWKMFSLGVEDTGWRVPLDLQPGMDLSTFIQIAFDESIAFGMGTREGKVRIRNHTLPQTHEFYSIEQATFVGRFESFDQDVASILKQLGLPEQTLSPRHVSERGPYQDYFTDETRRLAEEYYAKDLEVFGYEF